METAADSGPEASPCPRCAEHGELIRRARRMLERAAARVEGEIRRMQMLAGDEPPGAPALKQFDADIRHAEKTLLQLQDFLAKADAAAGLDDDIDGALDLEAAREEIRRRLDRLAKRG